MRKRDKNINVTFGVLCNIRNKLRDVLLRFVNDLNVLSINKYTKCIFHKQRKRVANELREMNIHNLADLIKTSFTRVVCFKHYRIDKHTPAYACATNLLNRILKEKDCLQLFRTYDVEVLGLLQHLLNSMSNKELKI